MTPADIPGWKRQEYSDLLAALVEYRDIEPLLAQDAERAWDEGYPISVVLHAAGRAWSQSTPGHFRAILANHAHDANAKLHSLFSDGDDPRTYPVMRIDSGTDAVSFERGTRLRVVIMRDPEPPADG